MDDASCACLTVEYRTDKNPAGYHSNCRWECRECARQFTPRNEIEDLRARLRELESTYVHPCDVAKAVADSVAEMQERLKAADFAIRDLLGYFEPKGGVSGVPLGPFERGEEALRKIRGEE